MAINISEILIGRFILNYTGGTLRWLYGSLYRNITNKPKFSYREYIYGPKNSKNSFDTIGHTFNNRIIGGIFIVLVIYLIIELTE